MKQRYWLILILFSASAGAGAAHLLTPKEPVKIYQEIEVPWIPLNVIGLKGRTKEY